MTYHNNMKQPEYDSQNRDWFCCGSARQTQIADKLNQKKNCNWSVFKFLEMLSRRTWVPLFKGSRHEKDDADEDIALDRDIEMIRHHDCPEGDKNYNFEKIPKLGGCIGKLPSTTAVEYLDLDLFNKSGKVSSLEKYHLSSGTQADAICALVPPVTGGVGDCGYNKAPNRWSMGVYPDPGTHKDILLRLEQYRRARSSSSINISSSGRSGV
jgi:hypothetical protein